MCDLLGSYKQTQQRIKLYLELLGETLDEHAERFQDESSGGRETLLQDLFEIEGTIRRAIGEDAETLLTERINGGAS